MRTIDYIKELEENFIRINKKQKEEIFKYWGEHIGNEFTEQDVWEQTRKILNKYAKY